jgi:hypothetical protein
VFENLGLSIFEGTLYGGDELKLPVFAIYLDTKKLATYTVLAFILGGLLGGAMWNFGGVFVPEPLSSASAGSFPTMS